jgi:hypothetical protein
MEHIAKDIVLRVVATGRCDIMHIFKKSIDEFSIVVRRSFGISERQNYIQSIVKDTKVLFFFSLILSQFLNYGLCERDHPVNKKMKSDDTSSKSQNWKHQIMYPEDVKEAARILKLYQPFGSKPWPEDGSSTKAIRKLIAKESSSSPTDNTKYSDPDFVLAILIQVGKYDVRQALYEAVDKTTVQSRESLVKTMGENLVRKRDSYKALTTKKLWFELAKLSLEKRDPEWIKEHGLCLEHLVPKKSTLSHAGFGGFSQYGVKYNDIVVPSPVLHVTNKETLMLYRRGIVENKELDLFKKNPDSFKLGMPLLLNYCFGHSESSMLMCPMTSAMLINHCSNRTNDCGPKGPNAEVRWSSGWDIASHEWRNKSLPVIDDHNGRILSLEIVSLRDIAPNEEGTCSFVRCCCNFVCASLKDSFYFTYTNVYHFSFNTENINPIDGSAVFIDYGIEWETAWDKHVREWKPPKKIPNFITAKEANQRKGPIIDDLISGDLRKTVDHPYLFTGCQYDAWDDVSNIGNYTKKWKNKWKMLSDEKILETFASPGDGFVYDGNKGYADHEEYSHWPCSILKAEKQKGRYTIRINMSPLKGVEPSETSWNKNEVPRILTNYPQESVHYFVKASATDQMLPTSFRHSIGFPHKLFPKQWKNRRISNVP